MRIGVVFGSSNRVRVRLGIERDPEREEQLARIVDLTSLSATTHGPIRASTTKLAVIRICSILFPCRARETIMMQMCPSVEARGGPVGICRLTITPRSSSSPIEHPSAGAGRHNFAIHVNTPQDCTVAGCVVPSARRECSMSCRRATAEAARDWMGWDVGSHEPWYREGRSTSADAGRHDRVVRYIESSR